MKLIPTKSLSAILSGFTKTVAQLDRFIQAEEARSARLIDARVNVLAEADKLLADTKDARVAINKAAAVQNKIKELIGA